MIQSPATPELDPAKIPLKPLSEEIGIDPLIIFKNLKFIFSSSAQPKFNSDFIGSLFFYTIFFILQMIRLKSHVMYLYSDVLFLSTMLYILSNSFTYKISLYEMFCVLGYSFCGYPIIWTLSTMVGVVFGWAFIVANIGASAMSLYILPNV